MSALQDVPIVAGDRSDGRCTALETLQCVFSAGRDKCHIDGAALFSFFPSATKVEVTTFQGKWSNDDGAHSARRPGEMNGQHMKSSVSCTCPTTALSAPLCDTRHLNKPQAPDHPATLNNMSDQTTGDLCSWPDAFRKAGVLHSASSSSTIRESAV